MAKILLIDGTNSFLRCYAAVPTLTSNGEPNGGVFGTLTSFGYIINLCQPDKVVITWDGVGGSRKRRSIIKEYKDKRKPTRLNRNFEFELDNPEANKIKQRLRLGEYLSKLPFHQVVVDEVEADDIIGYLNKFFAEDEKIIVSTDKDFYQLLSEKTKIYSPVKKKFIVKEDLVAEFKIHPCNFALARAIIGDVSDNLKGVKGVGTKNILKYFPMISEERKVTLEELLDSCDRNDVKYEKFHTNRQVIEDNLKVMQLSEVLISFSSTQKIVQALQNRPSFNATGFRMHLMEDGITKISDSFFKAVKILDMKEKSNG